MAANAKNPLFMVMLLLPGYLWTGGLRPRIVFQYDKCSFGRLVTKKKRGPAARLCRTCAVLCYRLHGRREVSMVGNDLKQKARQGTRILAHIRMNAADR
jgi:hypothetical protein